MKKITAIVSLLTLIAATSTKPMKEDIDALRYAKLISDKIEEIKLEKTPDWKAFDNKVNPWLNKLYELEIATTIAKDIWTRSYRTEINELKQTLVAAPPALPAPLTPLAVLEIDIQQLRSNLSEYFNNLLDGKIGTDQFTVKPFIEQVQKLEKNLPKLTPTDRVSIKKTLDRTKEAIGQLQIVYVNKTLDSVNKDLSMVRIGIIATKNNAIQANNNIVEVVKLLDHAIKRGFMGSMKFTDYFVPVIEQRAKKQYVIDFKTIVQNLRKTMVDVWEAILEVVRNDKKDKEMRKDLASNAGRSLALAIKMVENYFAKYLDDPKFTSTKGNYHPSINPEDFANLMKAEAEKF